MCKPSGGIKQQVGRIGDLKKTGTPNTRIDLYDKNGNLIQQRWYGPDGKAVWDRDWSLGAGELVWPHDHYWDWTKPPYRFAYEGPNGTKTNTDFC